MDLFTPTHTEWRPPETLPDLSRHDDIWFNLETTGNDVHVDEAVGMVVTTLTDSYYLPWGHRGGNLDKDRVFDWAHRELRGKTLIGSWIKFDAHIAHKSGLDLEALGCKLRDIQHQACLLNEQRRKSGLDILCAEEAHLLGGRTKLQLPFDKSRMRDVHSSLAGAYAEMDGTLTRDLDLIYRPRIVAQDLQRVLDVEDRLIFPVVEMERNGMCLDVPKLERWRRQVRKAWELELMELRAIVGFGINPESFPDCKRMFHKLGLEVPVGEDPKTGQLKETFGAELLKPIATANPVVARLRRVKALGSLLSKYLDKYAECMDADGILRYQLHQLRADERGTVTGRFSCAGYESRGRKKGANLQQVFHPEKQEEKIGPADWLIRELFVAGSPILTEEQRARAERACKIFCSADAAQIEYRIFAHIAGNPEIMAAYAADPDADLHQVITDMVRKTALPSATRKRTKNTNFAKIYGAGIPKLARTIGCSVEEAREFVRAYDKTVPEVAPMIDQAANSIKARFQREGVGYIKTMLGRRRRYHTVTGKHARLYSGLNAYIQGSAADIMKLKLLEVYERRHELNLTMRVTVHDELDSDCATREDAKRLHELLNQQTFPLKVPIRWAVEVGNNWAQLEKP